MARFEFRLKALLLVCEATRTERRAELAAVLAIESGLQAQRVALEEKLQGQLRQSHASMGLVDVSRLRAAAQYAASLRRAIADVSNQLRQSALEIERRRQLVVEADREVRMLVNLRERHYQNFREQEAATERKHLDEAAARTARQRLSA